MPRNIPRPAGGSGNGNVVGPPTSTSDAIVRFGSTTGDLLQDSIPTIDSNGNLTLNTGPIPNAAELRFVDANVLNPKYVAIKAPNTISSASSFAIRLPQVQGTANQALIADGAGSLVWQEPIFNGGAAGGSLTGTYPSPSLSTGAVDIGQLSVNVVNNYLPDTTQKQAMAGTSGTPGPGNAFVTQEGGTFTPVAPGPAYSVTDPVTSTTTFTQSADGQASFTPAPGASAFTVTDPATSVVAVDQQSDGTVTYQSTTNVTNNTEVTGGDITINSGTGGGLRVNSVNRYVTVNGDSTNYTYNAAPTSVAYFEYVLNQPTSVSAKMLDTGAYQLDESDTTVAPVTTGRLRLSCEGSSLAGAGVSIASYFDAGLGFVPAELDVIASSLRIQGDLAPNGLPGAAGEVLTSQGAGVPPIWTNVGVYTPTTSSDWSVPTPPSPANTGTVPTSTGEALDLLAAQNYARWQNTRTARTDTASGAVVQGVDTSISVILVDTTLGNVIESLPAASDLTGKFYTIKKVDSTVNTVTVDCDGADTVDGETSFVLGLQYDSVTVLSDGTSWHITDIGHSPGTPGDVLTSAGAGLSPTWTASSTFSAYTPTTASDWTTPTPTSTSPTNISEALDTLALQNYARWVNYRTTETRTTSSNAIGSDESVSAILVDATGGARVITLPSVATWANKWLTVKKTDATANVVSVVGDGGALIDGAGTYAIAYQYDAITVVSDGSSWSILDRIDSTPPTPVVSTNVSISLNGSATNGSPTFVGGFYVSGPSTYTTNSRIYVGINAPGTITVTVKNLVNSTITTFSYVAASAGFYDVTLASSVAFSAGWYNLTLTAVSAGTTAFIRGMYLTTV